MLSRAARILRTIVAKTGVEVAFASVVAVVLTWPLVPQFWTEAVGAQGTDTPKHLWTLWWMRRELWSGEPGLHTTLVNFPEGMDLFPISPLDGLLAAALPLGVVPLSNLLALLHVTLLGVCAAWLGREVVGTRVAGLTAGLLAQGTAFTGFALEVGVGELRLSWWIPLGLTVLARAHRLGRHRDFILLGVTLAAAVLACFYHGLFLAVATATWALATLRRDRRLLAGYVLAAGLALAIVVPVVRGFAASYGAEDARVLLAGASVSVDELVTPGTPGAGYDGGRYLGLGYLALAALGVAAGGRRTFAWLAVFGVCLTLALGPVLSWSGAPIVVGGRGFVLPMQAFNAVLSAIGEPINFPARFLAPAMIALAVLGAFATRWRLATALVPFAVAEVLAADKVAFPRATARLYDMTVFEGQGVGAVADLSMVVQSAEPAVRTRSISAQIALDRPFATVPIERLTRWSKSGDTALRQLGLFAAVDRYERGERGDAPDVAADLAWLREQGFTHLLLTHRNDTPDLRSNALLTAVCGEPVRARNATLWTLPSE